MESIFLISSGGSLSIEKLVPENQFFFGGGGGGHFTMRHNETMT